MTARTIPDVMKVVEYKVTVSVNLADVAPDVHLESAFDILAADAREIIEQAAGRLRQMTAVNVDVTEPGVGSDD